MANKKLKFCFFMLDLVGPQNACIGVGQVLLKRGHEVYFLTKSDHRVGEKFSKYGFTVCPILPEDKESKSIDDREVEAKIAAERIEELKQIRRLGLFEKCSPADRLRRLFDDSYIEEFFSDYQKYEPHVRRRIETLRPDFVVVDAIGVYPPSLTRDDAPWALLYCSNPLGVFRSPKLPPPTSGFPTASDPNEWAEYQQLYHDYSDVKILRQNQAIQKRFGYPVSEQFNIVSPYLNIYQFPEELDYHDIIEIPKNFFRVDAFCRDEITDFSLPAEFAARIKKSNDKLIYFSLGSMGNSDITLMRRVIGILGKTPHHYIVSMGAFHAELELAPNMWGANFLPQTKILPLVDLAIIHGGNNSLTESFYAGKPVIVLPIFFDQLDNGQRVHEKGLGIRIDPYDFEDHELTDAIDRILGNQSLIDQMHRIGERIRAEKRVELLCAEMEKIAIAGTSYLSKKE